MTAHSAPLLSATSLISVLRPSISIEMQNSQQANEIQKKAREKKKKNKQQREGKKKSAEETAVTGWQTKLQSMKERKECG